ncbi:MAG: type II secretion system F family protein [Phycisphaerae bacterium]|nr:type II secretion system F family protein [Phycisphaerae bacterium]
MTSDLTTIMFIVFPIIGSVLLAFGVYQAVDDSRKISRRKLMDRLKGNRRDKTSKEAESILKKTLNRDRSEELFGNLIGKLSFVPKLQSLLDQANLDWSASRMTLNLGVGALIASLGLTILGFSAVSAVGAAVAILLGPIFYLKFRRKRRLSKLTNQLPDVFAMMGQALRAGHGLASAIQLIHEQMPDPISTEFGRVFHEQNLGIKIEDALLSMADRLDSLDVRFFVTAVLIQRQTGGDLAEVLDKIGGVIQQRIELFGLVSGLTAEGRLSGWVLFLLPVVVFGASFVLNREYAMVLLTDPRGKLMLCIAIGMQMVGMAMIRWIVNIKV